MTTPSSPPVSPQDSNPHARFYRLLRQSSYDKVTKQAALGLVTTQYHELGPRPGETVTYRVVAVGRQGPSDPSPTATLAVPARPAPTMK